MTTTLCASFGDILRAIFSGPKKVPICNGKGPLPRVPSAMLFTINGKYQTSCTVTMYNLHWEMNGMSIAEIKFIMNNRMRVMY